MLRSRSLQTFGQLAGRADLFHFNIKPGKNKSKSSSSSSSSSPSAAAAAAAARWALQQVTSDGADEQGDHVTERWRHHRTVAFVVTVDDNIATVVTVAIDDVTVAIVVTASRSLDFARGAFYLVIAQILFTDARITNSGLRTAVLRILRPIVAPTIRTWNENTHTSYRLSYFGWLMLSLPMELQTSSLSKDIRKKAQNSSV